MTYFLHQSSRLTHVLQSANHTCYPVFGFEHTSSPEHLRHDKADAEANDSCLEAGVVPRSIFASFNP